MRLFKERGYQVGRYKVYRVIAFTTAGWPIHGSSMKNYEDALFMLKQMVKENHYKMSNKNDMRGRENFLEPYDRV